MSAPIAILTDFGSQDPFVGIMKGVIACIAPQAPTIDLTHAVPPGDIRRGALVLWQSAPYFPPETVFLVVIDPGVGTARRAIILQAGPGRPTFIGPDNGVFTFAAAQGYRAWTLENKSLALPNPTSTFHGRDIFAPAAAHAALGVPAERFGRPLESIQSLPAPYLQATGAALEGEVLYADHFGNLLTSLGRFRTVGEQQLALEPWLPGPPQTLYQRRLVRLVLPDERRLPLVGTFSQIPPGESACLVGSSGLLEIAANLQSAAAMLGLEEGTHLRLVEEIDT